MPVILSNASLTLLTPSWCSRLGLNVSLVERSKRFKRIKVASSLVINGTTILPSVVWNVATVLEIVLSRMGRQNAPIAPLCVNEKLRTGSSTAKTMRTMGKRVGNDSSRDGQQGPKNTSEMLKMSWGDKRDGNWANDILSDCRLFKGHGRCQTVLHNQK
jgi:hypothetical protein